MSRSTGRFTDVSLDGQSLLPWNAARSRSRSLLLDCRGELRSLAG